MKKHFNTRPAILTFDFDENTLRAVPNNRISRGGVRDLKTKQQSQLLYVPGSNYELALPNDAPLEGRVNPAFPYLLLIVYPYHSTIHLGVTHRSV